MTTIKEQTKVDWGKAPVICTINGVKWLLGPEAEEEMTWQEAVLWCKSVSGVLPPRDVLLQCYMNEDTKKEFTESYYWSSTKFADGSTWIQDFFLHGYQIGGVNGKTNSVRAVRAIKIGE